LNDSTSVHSKICSKAAVLTCLELEVLRLIVGFRYWWWIQLIDATLWKSFLRLTPNTAYQILPAILLIDAGPSYPKVVSAFSGAVWHWQS